jgi:hypothetical protein
MHEVIEKIKSHENCKCQESKFMRKNKNESYKKSKYFLTGLKNWAHVMNDLTINSHDTFGVHIILCMHTFYRHSITFNWKYYFINV